jgi:hypothetical protein
MPCKILESSFIFVKIEICKSSCLKNLGLQLHDQLMNLFLFETLMNKGFHSIKKQTR